MQGNSTGPNNFCLNFEHLLWNEQFFGYSAVYMSHIFITRMFSTIGVYMLSICIIVLWQQFLYRDRPCEGFEPGSLACQHSALTTRLNPCQRSKPAFLRMMHVNVSRVTPSYLQRAPLTPPTASDRGSAPPSLSQRVWALGACGSTAPAERRALLLACWIASG
jgi:hypothetical protein